jgi:integrase
MDELKTRIGGGQYTKKLARMRNDVFPWLGKKPITQIKAPDVFDVLKRIDSRSARYTARRVCAEISRVFRFANGRGLTEGDPTMGLLDSFPPRKEKHFAAITEPAEVAKLLRAIDAFAGTFPVLCALKLAPMVFVRPGELRKAKWEDIDLEKAEWGFHVTKTDTPHIVPLSKQAVAILKELQPLTGRGDYVFPGRDRKKPMSETTINAALQRMGYDTGTQMTGHGFRAMARTILHEGLEQKQEVIEHQLAHKVPDALGTAYNRTRFLKERKEMMQIWADYLEKLKAGAS